MNAKTQKMFALVEQFQQSGTSRREFCLEHDMPTSTFGYWIRRYQNSRGTDSGTRFIPIDLSGSTPPAPNDVEIHYPNGVRISVPSRDPAWIGQLIRLF